MEVELKGIIYRIGTLNVFDQWNVARRLMPLLSSLSDVKDDKTLLAVLSPVLGSIGQMSDEDTSYILNTCLAVVTRKDTQGNWVKILGGKNLLMFQDIDMLAMLRLTMYVITENMGTFFTQAASEDFGAEAVPGARDLNR